MESRRRPSFNQSEPQGEEPPCAQPPSYRLSPGLYHLFPLLIIPRASYRHHMAASRATPPTRRAHRVDTPGAGPGPAHREGRGAGVGARGRRARAQAPEVTREWPVKEPAPRPLRCRRCPHRCAPMEGQRSGQSCVSALKGLSGRMRGARRRRRAMATAHRTRRASPSPRATDCPGWCRGG